ncbi:MAG: UDP-N-acetylglucosamine 1-carboxyvinyltransferase [Elusimicrobia bacterium]|nr:UDP-N-acetylglucosamine 1-carboxyvinyltransferase [Elusimicrobiota bacterium]
MDKIVIEGGKTLKGNIKVSGAKNSALPILFATLLTDDKCIIENVPSLADIDTTISFLNFIGKKTNKAGSKVIAEKSKTLKHIAPYDLVRKMRASILIMGPLLARLKKVDVSLPGGCAIGARPIDIHLEAFKKMGAKINIEGGYLKCSAPKGLQGAVIKLKFASVGATENTMLAAVLARGTTKILNAAREPEIEDLANMLNAMGALITGAGTSKIIIQGVRKLTGVTHKVIGDRIEAATYMLAAAITKGDIALKNINPDHLKEVIHTLKNSGLQINTTQNSIHSTWIKPLKPLSIKTKVHPGFPTDVQAQYMALMCLTQGKSKITETVFENRFLHVSELSRFGANLKIDGNTVYINGVDTLSGAPVMASDLRAGAALVLAGLAAKGKTIINRVYHLDRGYENLEKKLKKVGATISRKK